MVTATETLADPLAKVDELRAFLDKVYNTAGKKTRINELTDDEVMNMATNLQKGLPLATPVFDGATEQEIDQMLRLAYPDDIAENLQLMPTPETRTGWTVWIVQTTILISLMITVNLGRRRMLDAYRSQNLALEHGREVERLLRPLATTLYHLGLSQAGHPKHPLYIGYDTQPEPWSG